MNFDPMWSVQQNSDVLFWIIALPVMAIVIPMFLLQDIKRMFHYLSKKMSGRRVTKARHESPSFKLHLVFIVRTPRLSRQLERW